MMEAHEAEIDRWRAKAKELEAALSAAQSDLRLFRENGWRETTRAQQLDRALHSSERQCATLLRALQKVFDLQCAVCKSHEIAARAVMNVREGAP